MRDALMVLHPESPPLLEGSEFVAIPDPGVDKAEDLPGTTLCA